MISIDDHPPPDPSSSDHQQKQVSHDFKINNGEKAPASVSDIDLVKPTDAILDDTNNNNQLPNFSIRDYVFGSRCKDIACNWPFSHENLQLCLQYGVKNLLPPFQSLDLINNPSGTRCAAENRLPDEETVPSSDGKSTGSIEPESQDLKKKSHPDSSEKTPNTTNRTTVKKPKLFMKLNSGVEEVTPNNFIVSETMLASKVCPVCKTFSSSSNTTLNAHIDRCLSEESTSMKWTTNSKIAVSKHRIKPRKTRLMVDIYKTAPCCTVEELDKRNGTSWATNSNFPDQELEFQAEEKKQEPTLVPEVIGQQGSVYIDTNGTKVRILSMPKVATLDDHEARKLQKGGKGSKIITEKKKKKKKAYTQKNRHKVFKLNANSKKFCSLNSHHPVSEAIGGEKDVAIEERCDKDVGEKPVKARVHKQMDDVAITRPPWACSKRTDLTKKRKSAMLTNPKEGSPLQDSYEDPLGTKSKSGKFSSLKDNPSSAREERNAGSKLILKRKFSALKKSRVDRLSTEINAAVMVPSQDSSKQKSQTEEDTSKKLSFEIVNVLEINTKKSITSKSSNGYSSSEDLVLDVESARTDQVQSHSDVQGSFMSLRNSFDDDEFSKMVSRIDNKFDIMNDDIEKQDNYFQEVDPIPIPGPPGSFLPPSPGGDMVSEEHQANSSLTTTSRFHSSEDQYHHHHDTIDKDSMLDSPISTVSSSSLARSAIRSNDKLSVGFASLQETIRYTGVLVDIVDHKSSSVKASNSRSIDAIDIQNEQPCVCSRKNGFESNRKPELFSLIDHPKLPPSLPPPPLETVKPHGDSSVKLPFYRDCEESAVISPTTPVLRLMGKNLTVVKMDDDHVPPPHQQQLHNIQNNDYTSFFYGNYPSDHDQHRVIFNRNQNGFDVPRHFNVNPSKNSRNVADLRPVTAPTDCHRLEIDHNEHDYPWKAAKEVIVIDDSSENEADDRMFQERMRRINNELHDGRWGSSSMLQSNSVGLNLIPFCPPYPG